MKFFTYLTASFTFLAIVAAPVKVANGCAGDFGYYVYSFIEPNIIEEPAYRPFFFTFQLYFDDWHGEEFGKDENLSEWYDYFDGKSSVEDIAHVIYKSSVRDLDGLIKGSSPTNGKDNSLFQLMKTNQDLEFLNYLIYAKSCEPYATGLRKFDWWEGTLDVDDSYYTNANNLVEEGLKAFRACENDFLKLRYAFQIIRMARYGYKWKRTIKLYEELMPTVKNVKSFIQYWTREHYAGALYNDGQKTEANYHFAQIFDKCPSRRFAAYRSFKIRDDAQWHNALAMCKSADEKAALYGIRAINPVNNAVVEMKSIYELTPNSKQLNFLLIREIQKLEYELLGADYNQARKNMKHTAYDPVTYDSYVDFPRAGSKLYLAELKAFVKKCLSEQKVQQPHVWKLADAYLKFISGNHEKAIAIFNQLEKESHGETFDHQVKVLKAAVEVDQLTKIDASVEGKIATYLKILKAPKSFTGESGISEQANYVLDKIALLYQKQGEETKAFLAKKYNFHNLLEYPKLEVITALIEMYDRDKKGQLSDFEKELTKPIFYKPTWEEKNGRYTQVYKKREADIRNKLLEMKGTAHLVRNELDKAIATYEALPEAYHQHDKPAIYWANDSKERFNINHVNPFHLYMGFEKVRNKDKTFNKLKLTKQLKRLEERVENGEGNPARFNYILGLYRFNMSYHGKVWRALDYYKTAYPGDEIRDNIYGWKGYETWGDQTFMFNEDALVHLNKAITLAKGEDREWAARACFVAGNCMTRDGADNKKLYWNKLKKEFSDTEFYELAINECDDFRMH